MGRIVDLARRMLEQAQQYEQLFESHHLAVPAFDAASFPGPDLSAAPAVAAQVETLRNELVDASLDLQELVRGPMALAMNTGLNPGHLAAIQAIYRYDIAQHVPASGDISYDDLAVACKLNAPALRRILRYAMTCRFFAEPAAGRVAHSAASKVLAAVAPLREWLGMVCDELWPASTRIIDALDQWPGSQEPDQGGFQLAHNDPDTAFTSMARDPARIQRFATAMHFFSSLPITAPALLIPAYPWASLGTETNVTLVDVGGSHGTVSAILARAIPKLHCVIQDLPDTIAAVTSPADGGIPPDLQGRLEFMAHDFFTPQTVTADVYLLRWILHDWPDKYAVKILRSLIPAMKPGARVLVNESCLPPPGTVPASQERALRASDLLMWALNNSQERDAEDWKALFEAADPRFRFGGVTMLPGSVLTLIEAVWEPGEE